MIFYGKPHRPIYDRAMAIAQALRGAPTPLSRVLAIGDSVRTDLTGAQAFGIDCLFVTRGIHADAFDGIDRLDGAEAKKLFGQPAAGPDPRTALVARAQVGTAYRYPIRQSGGNLRLRFALAQLWSGGLRESGPLASGMADVSGLVGLSSLPQSPMCWLEANWR